MSSKIEIARDDASALTLFVSGEWSKEHLSKINVFKKSIDSVSKKEVLFNFSADVEFDSAGIMQILDFADLLRSNGCSVIFENLKEEHKRVFVFYRKNYIKKNSLKDRFHNPVTVIGKHTVRFAESTLFFFSFLGESATCFFSVLLKPVKFRFTSFVKHIDHSGIRALPIIGLTAFLVGLVISYQASDQLAKYGANIFIVEMSAISLFRELSPLIAAIVIAGRSASAFTAEIGTMKITEEVDAMNTMGFDPHLFLVLPRIFALMIAMPLLVFFADMTGVFGAMIIAKANLDITFLEFVSRMRTEVPIKHIMIGIIKAPIYGIIIAIIGCYRGFQVSESTDSIGSFTTKSVVNAIFWVIACNAIISILLTEMGI